MGSKPKEDPADKAARLRERRITEIDRQAAAEKNAAGLSSDLRAVYGMRGFLGSAGGIPVVNTPGSSSATGLFKPRNAGNLAAIRAGMPTLPGSSER